MKIRELIIFTSCCSACDLSDKKGQFLVANTETLLHHTGCMQVYLLTPETSTLSLKEVSHCSNTFLIE